MPIDWFTVVAQVINFLILVGLMERFLYKPILHAIDEREKGISNQLAQAAAKKAESQKEHDEFQHKNEAFDQERAGMWQKSTDEVKAERTRLLEKARTEADEWRAKRQEALQSEQRHLNREITQWTQKQVFAIARKTLADLSAEDLEARITAVFVSRLRAISGPTREQFAADLKASSDSVRVRSAFELPPAQRADIQRAINETFSTDVKIQFDTKPDIVSGIELSTKGQKVAWSIADYLAALEKSAGELLPGDSKSERPSRVPPGSKLGNLTAPAALKASS
ncbi:F0F1 ATP synthase subunit delta [Telmatocola sphagniphila]|uniref:ATP synthase subunit b n=1 Tax=Telmatocola sphagniphila TaxID=1123043 RepID=A0A8E6EWK2_9BACT|nr:F0F1 ATP synthase subunit delta [Telmatocola sphagniphila]QVL34075.1 F0F1 ATP synthase subunit delta [Telmatocola sphagniphila]